MEEWARAGVAVVGRAGTDLATAPCVEVQGRGARSITEQSCRAVWEVSEGPGPRRETHTTVEGVSKQSGSVGYRRAGGLSASWVSAQTPWPSAGLSTVYKSKTKLKTTPHPT